MAKKSLLSKLLKIPNYNVNKYPITTLCIIIILEALLSFFIIQKVQYTEIDWNAYMQQVKAVIEGEFNYKNLKGDTGPLVYPAGFVYIYTILYFITDHGTNILKAQYVFLILHVFSIYAFIKLLMNNTRKLPLWVVVFTCISRRIHSIFLLRLFNDCFAVFFCYLSLMIFSMNRSINNTSTWWYLGSIVYSFAVSIKMNILLYAPAIGLLYFKYLGCFGTIKQVSVCVLTQLCLGAPFLITYPMSYISRAFNFSKDFEYKWTLNFKFINEELFLDKRFGHCMLIILLLLLLSTAHFIWCYKEGGLLRYVMVYWKRKKPHKYEKSKKRKSKHKMKKVRKYVDGEYFLDRLFLCNFMGIVMAKSLHAQFYVWYFHTIPYLVWRSSLTLCLKWILVLCIEIIWNIFPSNALTSIALWICHLILLYGVLVFQYKQNRKKKQA